MINGRRTCTSQRCSNRALIRPVSLGSALGHPRGDLPPFTPDSHHPAIKAPQLTPSHAVGGWKATHLALQHGKPQQHYLLHRDIFTDTCSLEPHPFSLQRRGLLSTATNFPTESSRPYRPTTVCGACTRQPPLISVNVQRWLCIRLPGLLTVPAKLCGGLDLRLCFLHLED